MVALLFLRFEDRFSSPANLHPLSAYNLQGGGGRPYLLLLPVPMHVTL